MSNGQSDNIFQPARFFASAGILDIQTLTPRFEKGKRTNISAAFKTGSWGLVNPSILLEQQLSPQWTVSANGEWMSSDGQYPYTLRYGNAADDLTSREKRKNTDVETFRAEAGLYGNFSDKEQWRLKAYYFQSSRGLPKATTLYNDFSAQHLWDKNTFIQSQYKKEFSRQWVFRTSAKWNWSYQHYLDPAIKNNEGKTAVSYTHLTLPTNREVKISVVAESIKKKKEKKGLIYGMVMKTIEKNSNTGYERQIKDNDVV